MKIPHAQQVTRALRSVRSATKDALKSLNRVAGQRMAKGDYAGAEMLAAKGREIGQFLQQVDELARAWRQVSGRGGTSGQASKTDTTPLWGYYQPILRAIVKAGGDCTRADIENALHAASDGFLQPGDRGLMASGHERWKVMIRRARKPLRAEGWIQERPANRWRITEAGRRAAERAPAAGPGDPQR